MIEILLSVAGLTLFGFAMHAVGQQHALAHQEARALANAHAVAYLQMFRITLRTQARYGAPPPQRLEHWADEIDAVLALAHEQAPSRS